MKCESVVKINLAGEYEVIYLGSNRSEARQAYRENMAKKDEYLALFQNSGYISRSISRQGFIKHSEDRKNNTKPAAKKKASKKKEE